MKKDKHRSHRPATMRDVAKLAGVSQPTVSRVLNQSSTTISISEETRSRVMAAVEKLSYRPNVLARGLRTHETQMIAVMIADICNSFYHPIVRSIQDIAGVHNFDVMIANTDHLRSTEILFCESVTRRPVDGVIMVPQHLTVEELDNFMRQTGTPVVILGNHIDHPQIDVIHAHDEQAIFDATRWLIDERGHRTFGVIGVEDVYPPGPRRVRGIVRALKQSQLQLKPEHLVKSDWSLDGGGRAACELMQNDELPTVVIALNDLMAIGAILAFQDAGYRVPEDVAVMGYDDIPEARLVRPALTTIAQDSVDLGRKLANSLFERIENPDLPRRFLLSPQTLIKRDST